MSDKLPNCRPLRKEEIVVIDDLCQQAEMDPLSGYDRITVAVWDDDRVCGFARVIFFAGQAYLSPLIVDENAKGLGIGSLLIDQVLKEHPSLLLVSRGPAHDFYLKCAAQDVAWDIIAPEVIEECDNCPDRSDCKPQPMRLTYGQQGS